MQVIFCVHYNIHLIRKMKLTCFTLLFFLCQFLSGQMRELYTEIDKIIRYDTEIKYPIEKSFIVGVIKGDSTYILNFGDEHIDTFDLFEIGGVTKVFTSTLATKLHQEDLIDLNKSVNTYLPDNYKNTDLESYTLADLLMHQINFPKRPANLAKKEYDISNPYAYYTKQNVLEYYANFKPPGKLKLAPVHLSYSHVNYALVEIILESEMKMPLEDLFQFYLFQEWEMQHTSLAMPGLNLSTGYDRSNMIPEPWTFQSFAGSEGLVSCLNDLLHFTRLSMDSNDPIFSGAQEIHEKSKIYNKLAHSYAWYIMSSRRTGDLYTHSGQTERHKAYIHFKPESRTGVVILCQSSEGVGELGMLILRMINNNWKKIK